MKSLVRVIGSIYGSIPDYEYAIAGSNQSIQLGNVGIGIRTNREVTNWPIQDGSPHYFIRGNHDNPDLCRESPQHLESGTHREFPGVFFVGGGHSVRHDHHTPGVDWWPNEEHTKSELADLTDLYKATAPRVVISHEAPDGVEEVLWGYKRRFGGSRTARALRTMVEAHRPALWLFGHYDTNASYFRHGTRYACLGIGSYLDIDLSLYT